MQSFGFEIPSATDPAIQYIDESGKRSIEGKLLGSYIVDILLVLQHLPLPQSLSHMQLECWNTQPVRHSKQVFVAFHTLLSCTKSCELSRFDL